MARSTFAAKTHYSPLSKRGFLNTRPNIPTLHSDRGAGNLARSAGNPAGVLDRERWLAAMWGRLSTCGRLSIGLPLLSLRPLSVFALLAILLLSSPLPAQSVGGTITGIVTDAAYQPIVNASVQLTQ